MKINLENKSLMLQGALSILEKIEGAGHEAFIVGGAVRDMVMGIEPKDFDISTSADFNALEKIWKLHDIGKSKNFGICVIEENGFRFEVAQYRVDSKESDGRRPNSIKITSSFKDDCSRRDLTVNALGMDKNGNVVDYFNGLQDIENKILRTVGDPTERFKEDFLRMIRVCRFSARLGFTIESETKKAIRIYAINVGDLSPERIKDELWKMASQPGDKFADAVSTMLETSILRVILPEISMLSCFEQSTVHHPEGNGNVLQHVLAAVRQNKTNDPLINISLLFHDIGKDVTHTWDEKKNRHAYHGHGDAGGKLIEKIAERLKFSNDEKEAIVFAAVNHMKLHGRTFLEMSTAKCLKLIKDKNWELLKTVSFCDTSCRLHAYDPKTWDVVMDKVKMIEEKFSNVDPSKVTRLVNGKRVMVLTGANPSPLIGQIVKRVSEVIVNQNVTSDEEIDNLILVTFNEIKG
jgi:tRNA nucleotidyltransferase (CCA-adding enzyme)